MSKHQGYPPGGDIGGPDLPDARIDPGSKSGATASDIRRGHIPEDIETENKVESVLETEEREPGFAERKNVHERI